MFNTEINQISELLKANPSINIELTGHSEKEEINEAKINRQYNDMARRRANAVKEAIVAEGIEESRVSVISNDNNTPATDKTTPLGKAQNRRVEFSVK